MIFGSYKAARNDKGHLVIENVPIFVECKRGETHFSDDWITTAVQKAKQAELEGYLPPLHIRHHEAGTPVEPAGYFRIRGAAPITFKGKTRTAIFADLVVTRPGVEDDVLAARLPYRSVEIFDVDEPAINSLALLDHEPPYLELPMLMVDEPAESLAPSVEGTPERTSGTLVRVADATFCNPWQSDSYTHDDPVVACFRRGHSAHLFLEDIEPMTVKKNTKAAPQPRKGAKFGDYEKETMADEAEDGEKMADDESEDGEMMEDGMMDVGAVCSAIRDGSISVAEMEEIKAAIVEQMSSVGVEEEAGEEEAPAPAPVPGEAMRAAKGGAQFAAMQAKIDAQEVKLAQMEHETARKTAVDDALVRLEGRPLGSDPSAKFGKRFDELGAAGFKLYVNDLAGMFGKMPSGAAGKAAAFAGQAAAAPESALSYTDQGADAVERAAKFAAEHRELAARSMTRKSEEAYVLSNMARAGFKSPK